MKLISLSDDSNLLETSRRPISRLALFCSVVNNPQKLSLLPTPPPPPLLVALDLSLFSLSLLDSLLDTLIGN